MPAVLRPARASDIDALVAIEAAAFATDRISRRSFRRLISRPTALTSVVERDGRIVGYCMVLVRNGAGAARLYSIATLPDAAGDGIGRLLLEAAENSALAARRDSLRLEVREDNPRAIRLYERAGYRRIGREEAYYADGWAALRFEKQLAGASGAATSRNAA